MSGSRSKRKGSGYELEVVRAHQALGVDAFKTPLSGALGGRYRGDVQVAGLIGECKRRARGFGSLYDALDQQGADVMFARDDKRDTLVVLPWSTWAQIIKWLDWPKKFPHRAECAADAHRQIDNANGENDA